MKICFLAISSKMSTNCADSRPLAVCLQILCAGPHLLMETLKHRRNFIIDTLARAAPV